jgi:hypothetical protein
MASFMAITFEPRLPKHMEDTIRWLCAKDGISMSVEHDSTEEEDEDRGEPTVPFELAPLEPAPWEKPQQQPTQPAQPEHRETPEGLDL